MSLVKYFANVPRSHIFNAFFYDISRTQVQVDRYIHNRQNALQDFIQVSTIVFLNLQLFHDIPKCNFECRYHIRIYYDKYFIKKLLRNVQCVHVLS